ncbi:hypothetical protein LTR24_009663 [Lithohypha guttulata]|uniref:Autophagy-related protein 16 domain-containing protein n=1 Tax=Lithohypha guttulata TaxID=1690604 RepID=A0ABR0JXX7_9EURO|nr:hypothetical protein LTR24_009663 [Lithohypha guttulata]
MAHTSGPAQQLGLDVDPADVRLVPGPADPYAWRYGLEQEHLFRRQLSKHNVSAYRQICQHLGHAIQAVLHDGQPMRSSTPRDVDSGERSKLPPSRSARSPPSHGCGDGEPGHTTRELSTEHPSTLQELETEKQSLTARLEVAMSVAEERNIEIQRLQESNDTTEQHLRELQATIQQRDVEALRCTQLVVEYKEKEQAMTVLLHGWERGLRTLQLEVGTALQHQTSVSNA